VATTQEIRRWAADNGVKVAPRGAIPKQVQEAYKEAHRRRPKAESNGSTAPKAEPVTTEVTGTMPQAQEHEGRPTVLLIQETVNGNTIMSVIKSEAVYVDTFSVNWDQLNTYDDVMEALTETRLLPESEERKRLVKSLAGRLSEVGN
jgi:hypothetical protein